VDNSLDNKPYDLEERTFKFAKMVSAFCKQIPKNHLMNQQNLEYSKQLIRSSSSVGSNYIEANEAVSKKDFVYRIRICRKEAKESAFFLRLIVETNDKSEIPDGSKLIDEAIQLKKIFSAIIEKSK